VIRGAARLDGVPTQRVGTRKMLQLRHKHRGDGPLLHGVTLVPKLQLGNSVREAPASSLAKLELRLLGSQAGAWEPAEDWL